ncbi:PREDICTED: prefoldin subunit 4 isoform X2 [Myotis brandtii]|uniref:prefoldin subunit 4 isoform X2 n=1 Tax=Myotis brandtii TaxID=109478 RepID=UPI000704303E|nr:PREDICTED: prefoldin subunit 4 isoform X2 [Myotis brandtii]
MLGNREEKGLDPGFCPIFHHQHFFLHSASFGSVSYGAGCWDGMGGPWFYPLGLLAVQTSGSWREARHRGSHRSVQSAAVWSVSPLVVRPPLLVSPLLGTAPGGRLHRLPSAPGGTPGLARLQKTSMLLLKINKR